MPNARRPTGALRGAYRAIYEAPVGCRHGDVVVYTDNEPDSQREFRVPIEGLVTFSLKQFTLNPTQKREHTIMAKKTQKAADDLAELEELEGLEDLDEVEEPDDVDEDEVEEAPKKRRSRSKAKAKAAPAEDEADDEEEDEKPKTLKELRAEARAAGVKGVAKMKREELEAAIASAGEEADDEDEDEEEDDEPEEEAPKKRSKSKAKGATAKPKAEKDGIGTAEIAEAAGVDGRKVRVFLRKNAERFPKPDGQHNYRWPSIANKDAKRLIAALQKEFAED